MKTLLTILAATLAAAPLPAAENAPRTFRSGPARVPLVELFTSEGCSSCPPAEAWLAQQGESPGLWREFVPVVFHVDYWDRLGWRDAWSRREFTERQRSYAHAWRSATIYTPGFALNGREWRAWSRGAAELQPAAEATGVLALTQTATNRWEIRFEPAAHDAGAWSASVARLAGGLVSEVRAGENRGRRLTHDFTVISLLKIPLTPRANAFVSEVVLPAEAPSAGRPALAAWVTNARHLDPRQAVGGWLEK